MNVLRLTLRQLQIFVAVARTGSTMAASGELALSQSATSSALNELERVLNLRLFDRAGKRLQLNDNGRALVPRALALLDAASGIEDLSRPEAAQAHALRIGASTTIGNYVLPGLLSRFFAAQGAHEAPAWQSRVMIANTADICASVASFELDIGLIEGASHEPALNVHLWRRDELVIVAAPGSAFCPAVSGAALTLKALREAVWLLRERGSGTRETTDQFLLPHLRGYRRSIELGSSEAIKRAVAHGLGVACLSRWVVQELIDAQALCELRTPLPALKRPCYWVVHQSKQFTPALQAFVAALNAERQAGAG